MTTMQTFLMFFLVLLLLVGVYLLYRGNKGGANYGANNGARYDKNGIPIIPRHERDLIDDFDIEDPLASDTIISPDRSYLQPIIEDNTYDTEHESNYRNSDFLDTHRDTDVDNEQDHENADFMSSSNEDNVELSALSNSQRQRQKQGLHEDDDEYAAVGKRIDALNNDQDLFSSLASATENLTPAIDPAEEPEFIDNSPILDQHLLDAADQDQNSPLNYAEENINISLLPKNKFTTIEGATVLSLIEQYGLKYGAMNMFHRYENKDGSGILWFSMMGIVPEGITPFDLNTLTATEFNGLVLFLSLPHPKALQGFDSMMSIAGLIAKQLDIQILDEQNELLTRERKIQLRNRVQEYQQQR